MDKIPSSRPRDREDILAKARLLDTDGRTIAAEIVCKTYLPKQRGEAPYVEFLATEKQYDAIAFRHSVEFFADLEVEGRIVVTLHASELLLRNRSKRIWGKGNCSLTVDGVPMRLLQVQFFENDSRSDPPYVCFRLSPNKLLFGGHSQARYFDGTVEVSKVDLESYELAPGFVIQIDEHVNHIERESDGKKREFIESNLVATVSKCGVKSYTEVESVLRPDLDDFLLVASLATDCRIACLGWDFRDEQVRATEFSDNFGFPNGDPENNYRWGLWEGASQAEFLRHAWSAFRASEDHALLRRVILTLVPGERRPISMTFLGKFAALEGLLQLQAKRAHRSSVISRSDWRLLLLALKAEVDAAKIGQSTTEDERRDAVKRRHILKEGLPELNRPRPRASFDIFCNELELEVSDLWTVFGSDKKPGLYQIRNKLIHGFAFPVMAEDALYVAERNLHWVVTRMLLRLWDWQIRRSAVHPHNAAEPSLQPKMVEEARQLISQVLM